MRLDPHLSSETELLFEILITLRRVANTLEAKEIRQIKPDQPSPPLTLKDVAEQWHRLGASGRVRNAMARAGISVEAAQRMSNAELKRPRGIGAGSCQEIRQLLEQVEFQSIFPKS